MGFENVDVIVVGGGTAGLSFASHLCRITDLSVSLYEAGSSFDTHPVNLFSSMARRGVLDTSTSARAAEGCETYQYLQAHLLGGGSAINGMISLPGAVDDFNEWCEYGGLAEWSWDHVEPWFRQLDIQVSHVTDDEPHSVARLVQDAWPSSRLVPLAYAHGGRQLAVGTGFASAQKSGRLSVYTTAAVARVIFDGSRAVGVELADGTHHRAHCVVMCAGTLRTPLILRKSGFDAEGLGENLQDHPNVMFSAQRRASFDGHMPISRYVSVKVDDDDEAPDIAHILGYEQIDAEARLAGIGVSLMDVHSRGALVEDSNGGWRAEFRCLSDLRDIREMSNIVRDVSSVLCGADLGATFEAVGAQRLGTEVATIATMDDQALADWIRRHVRTLSHAVGTCAMGAVCDSKGRVADLEGLWVADASIMPRIVRANTNLTVAMMATRVAQFVADGWGE